MLLELASQATSLVVKDAARANTKTRAKPDQLEQARRAEDQNLDNFCLLHRGTHFAFGGCCIIKSGYLRHHFCSVNLLLLTKVDLGHRVPCMFIPYFPGRFESTHRERIRLKRLRALSVPVKSGSFPRVANCVDAEVN